MEKTESQSPTWKIIDSLLAELIEEQQRKLLACGRRIVPTLTPDDILQPVDFPELELHPEFRYEEGILAGLHAAAIALKASR